jgi:hypothetical protein
MNKSLNLYVIFLILIFLFEFNISYGSTNEIEKQLNIIEHVKNIMKHKAISINSKKQFPTLVCECKTELRKECAVGLCLKNGCSCSSTAEYIYQHLALIPMKFKARKVYDRTSSYAVENLIRDDSYEIRTFQELKIVMENTENKDIIWDFDDGINDHEFLIINIDNQFTLLQSWIHLWSMESWLGEDLQFPNFYPRGYRFKDMDTDTLEKMRNFHQKMGKGQFFSFETFWNYFEKYYGEFIQAMAIYSSKTFSEELHNPFFVRNYVQIGIGDISVNVASKINPKYLKNGIKKSKI